MVLTYHERYGEGISKHLGKGNGKVLTCIDVLDMVLNNVEKVRVWFSTIYQICQVGGMFFGEFNVSSCILNNNDKLR